MGAEGAVSLVVSCKLIGGNKIAAIKIKMSDLIPVERIENKIFLIRGQKVMLAGDLAKLYGVKTKVLNQAVQRNIDRFPEDFMFQLSQEEFRSLRSQFVTLNKCGPKRGKHAKYFPYAFTEQGVAMLSSVLRSKRAIYVNVLIMRVFVKLRQILATHKDLAHKLNALEQKTQKHDAEIHAIFDAIRKLTAPPEKPIRRIGFRANDTDESLDFS